MRGARAAGALAVLCVATAYSSTSVATLPADHAGGTAASGRVTSSARSGSAAGGAPTRTATAPAADAVPPSEPAPQVSTAQVRTADGSIVTIATFRGPVRYVLHNGSADPGPAAAGLVRAGPAVTGNERGPLTAAVPGQDRPADQYLTGWARDFITVLGPPAGPQATRPAINSRLRP